MQFILFGNGCTYFCKLKGFGSSSQDNGTAYWSQNFYECKLNYADILIIIKNKNNLEIEIKIEIKIEIELIWPHCAVSAGELSKEHHETESAC